jgi:hypothetical protein
MKVKLLELINSQKELERLGKKQLPVKSAYWIKRITDKVYHELDLFYKQRKEIIEKYQTEEGEKGKKIPKEYVEKADKEINELAEIEIEIDINKIKIEDLGEVNIEPELLLSYIFE